MEMWSKRLNIVRPHIRYFNGTWRASQIVVVPGGEPPMCILEMWGRSPEDAAKALQRALAVHAGNY